MRSFLALLLLAANVPAWTKSFVPHRRDWRTAGQEVLAFSPRDGGGSIFRIIFADPRRWEGVDS